MQERQDSNSEPRNLTANTDEEAKRHQYNVASKSGSHSSEASNTSTPPRPRDCLLDTSDSSRLPCYVDGLQISIASSRQKIVFRIGHMSGFEKLLLLPDHVLRPNFHSRTEDQLRDVRTWRAGAGHLEPTQQLITPVLHCP